MTIAAAMTVAAVLLTWATLTIGTIGIGLLVLKRLGPVLGPRDRAVYSVWVGFGLLLLVAVALNLAVPMQSVWSGLTLGVLMVVGWIAVTHFAASNRDQLTLALRRARTSLRWPQIVLLSLFAVGMLSAAVFATGEPMDADAGLYRVGAINYASEYRVIPGLANLHDRFGFNSTLWPLTGWLGNGLWADQSYRIVTGFVLSLVFATITARIAVPRRGGAEAGDWCMVIGGGFVAGLLLQDTGRWIASPAQDIVILCLSIVSTAFLVDYVTSPHRHWTGGAAVLVAAMAGSVRPLGWLLMAVTMIVVAARSMVGGTRPWSRVRSTVRLLSAPCAYAAVLLAVMLARDALLSGWLMYPLTYFPLDVSWRASDPTLLGRWITAYARAPGEDFDTAMVGTGWLKPWLQATSSAWEVRPLAYLGLAVAAPLLWRSGRAAWGRSWRAILWALPPGLVVVGAWFVTAPDLRFGWGGLSTVALVPLAILLSRGAYPGNAVRVAGVGIVVMLLFTAFVAGRFDRRGAERELVPASVGPITGSLLLGLPPDIRTVPSSLGDGTPTMHPTINGNCWTAFPLCLLEGTGPNVVRMGEGIQEGFRIRDR